MTREETLQEARAITAGSTCFVIPRGDRFNVCRRVGKRIINLGYRTDGAQLCRWLRKLTSH